MLEFIASDNLLKNTKLTVKQSYFIDTYLNLKELYPRKQYKVSEVLQKTGYSRGVLSILIKKEIFAILEHSISRLLNISEKQIENKKLADFQQNALDEIKKSFEEKTPIEL